MARGVKAATCAMCGVRATRLVKWPNRAVYDAELGVPVVRVKRRYCDTHAARVICHQRIDLGVDVKAYPVRQR
jgi:hypothetical protein